MQTVQTKGLDTLIRKSKMTALIFRALNNKSRQLIMKYLQEHPHCNVTNLYKALKMEQAFMSQHLSILKSQGIVSSKRDGKLVLYSLNEKRLAEIEGVMDQLLNG